MEKESVNTEAVRLAPCASHAVGMEKSEEKRRWVIGIVLNNTEIASRDRLIKMGIEAYVPSQTEIRKWKDGRRKRVERIIFKNFVFLHVTEQERHLALNTPFVKDCYRVKHVHRRSKDLAGKDNIIVIPDTDIEKMQFMLYNSPNPVEHIDVCFHKGDNIEVIRGSLIGLTGQVYSEPDGHSYLTVDFGILGCAKTAIDMNDVKIIPQRV